MCALRDLELQADSGQRVENGSKRRLVKATKVTLWGANRSHIGFDRLCLGGPPSVPSGSPKNPLRYFDTMKVTTGPRHFRVI